MLFFGIKYARRKFHYYVIRADIKTTLYEGEDNQEFIAFCAITKKRANGVS